MDKETGRQGYNTSMSDSLPRYDVDRTYQWNYEHAPRAVDLPEIREIPRFDGTWTYAGQPVGSPLGVAAGPLLNGAWCLYYARLGFDVVTYKTVRSRYRECYPAPNLTPVTCRSLSGVEQESPESTRQETSWAVSYGMPSQEPEIWQADVRKTVDALKAMPPMEPQRPLLSVSVVGSVQPDDTLDALAEDYARCAEMANKAGADCVEANFSCPNVSTCDGQLYQLPDEAAEVARRIAAVLGDTPLIIKIGHVTDEQIASRLVEQLSGVASALAMTNSVATKVRGLDGHLLFDGQPRGICGEACRDASLRQVATMRQLIDRAQSPLRIVGVGGIFTAEHVRSYLDAGAESVQLATAVMQQPDVALRIRETWQAMDVPPR